MRRVPALGARASRVQFADGCEGDDARQPACGRVARRRAVAAPIMMPRGGSGGDRSWDLALWVWPLPPLAALGVRRRMAGAVDPARAS